MQSVHRSSDGLVSKFIHNDSSETSIKVVPSKDTTLEAETRINDRGKYTVFISSSAGCYLSCSFCDLTISGMKYNKVSEKQVLANLKSSLLEKVKTNPDIKDRYIKLSWMGMGDALNVPKMVRNVTIDFLDWVLDLGYAAGLDGIDLSTSFADVSDEWINIFAELNNILKSFPRNPNNKDGRPPFRLFYSLQSGFEDTRKKLVPKTVSIDKAMKKLRRAKKKGLRLVFHYVVLDGINDSPKQADKLVKTLDKYGFSEDEIRFLRYNPHPDSPFKESERRFDFAKEVADRHPNVKLQISEGREVRSACGQFLYGQV